MVLQKPCCYMMMWAMYDGVLLTTPILDNDDLDDDDYDHLLKSYYINSLFFSRS